MSESEPAPTTRSFAEKFAHLIATIHPPDRDPYTDLEIADVLGKSRQYVWQLRTGERGEPRQSLVLEITRFFGVPDDYFVSDEVSATVDAEIDALVAHRDASGSGQDPREGAEVRRLAQRVMGLAPQHRQAVSNLIESLQAYDEQPRARRQRRKPTSEDRRP
jgi:transcriptional regulator with XRE-family HTH domain